MKITRKMLNELELLKTIPKEPEGAPGRGALLGPYMEYPTKKAPRYVMQWHIRGKSVHTDWRMEVNDHLVGWTVLTPGGIPKTTHTIEEAKEMVKKVGFEFSSEKKNKGFRAETKARQPKVWLTVEGVVKPGEVGATKEHPGVLLIVDTGQVYFGAQKPYFHEYFIKSDKKDGPFSSKDWTRIVVRAVNVNVIDPETKKPKEGTELMWRVLVPGDQTPYAIDRGFKKKWIPPKDYIPVPPDWRKGEKYEAWEKWVKEAWASGRKSEEEESLQEDSFKKISLPISENISDLKNSTSDESRKTTLKTDKEENREARFVVHYMSYMGQIVVRGIPHQKWFLRLKDGDKVRSWSSDFDFTRFSPVPLQYEGLVDSKWFDYEGDIPPNSKYNPSKTLTAKMQIVDSGSCKLNSETQEGAEQIAIEFKGTELQGKYLISQEEKGTPIFTIERLREELTEARFVLQEHYISKGEQEVEIIEEVEE